jgi:hypothetical protein
MGLNRLRAAKRAGGEIRRTMTWALPLQTRLVIGSAQLRWAVGERSGDGCFRVP